jgi:hypothetical protein
MDGDLFHWLVVAVMAAGLLVLVALLSTRNGIKRALEQGGLGAPSTSSAAFPASTSEVQATQVAPQEQTSAASIRTVLENHGAVAPAQAQPVQAQPVQAQPVQAQAQPVAAQAQPAQAQAAATSAFAAHADADEPQDEPFQRDGRWWFRRGDELLVYDDATGQWQPAEQAAAPAAVTAAAAPAQTQEVPVAASGGGWKCTNCGAVNGSTASSCRMCFTPRA